MIYSYIGGFISKFSYNGIWGQTTKSTAFIIRACLGSARGMLGELYSPFSLFTLFLFFPFCNNYFNGFSSSDSKSPAFSRQCLCCHLVSRDSAANREHFQRDNYICWLDILKLLLGGTLVLICFSKLVLLLARFKLATIASRACKASGIWTSNL